MSHVSRSIAWQAGRLCPHTQQRVLKWGQKRGVDSGLGSGHAQARCAYVFDGRGGMLLLAGSKQGLGRSVTLLAGADVRGAHEDLVSAVGALRSHCVHNALQSKSLACYGNRTVSPQACQPQTVSQLIPMRKHNPEISIKLHGKTRTFCTLQRSKPESHGSKVGQT